MTDNYGHIQPSHCKTCKELAEDCECKRDRLLSEQEICKLCGSGCEGTITVQCDWRDDKYGECHKLLAAQLAKTDKEWVEWAETTLRACTTRTCKYHDKNCLYLRDILCGAWQERKRSVGL